LTFAPETRLAPAGQQQAQLQPSPMSPSGGAGDAMTPGGFVDPNKIILAGYLMKQGKRKNWRKRWFVLQSTRLMYSRSHMVSHPWAR
jgi:hypothetical protein